MSWNSKIAASSNVALFSALLAGVGTLLTSSASTADANDSRPTSHTYETLAQVDLETADLRIFFQGTDPDAPDPNNPDPVPEPDWE